MVEENSLPKHWQIKKLVDVCDEIFAGGDVPKNNFSLTSSERYHIPIYANGEKNKGLYGYTNIPRVNTPSLTISARGTIGYAEVRSKPFFPIVRLIVLKPNKSLDVLFLKYVIDNCNIKHTGSSIPQLTVPTVKILSIPLPPLQEQKLIVSKIEELLSDLDNGKQQLLTSQQQLKVYRQSLLKWAFEGKLSEEWRKQNPLNSYAKLLKLIQSEKERSSKETGKKLKTLAPITDTERTNLPELPKEWGWVKLGDNAFVTKLAGFEFTKYVRYKDVGDIPVIRAQNVSRYCFIPRNFLYVDREIMEKLPRSRVLGGEILMVFVGAGLGNVGIVPDKQVYFLGPNVAKIALEKQFSNKFILHFLTSKLGFDNVTGMSKATAQGSISMANIREVSVPLISIEEQNYIVQELESKLTVCDKIEETICQSLLQAETLRQSILKKAFEGKLVSLNYDSDDEFDKHEMGIAAEEEVPYKKGS